MGPKKCILIVDDEPNVRLVLQTALVSVGYRVIEAEDGQSALEHLASSSSGCDLILLDLLMPRMDGMELLSRLRSSGNVVPVVILTAHGSIPEAVAAMRLGAIDFLTKLSEEKDQAVAALNQSQLNNADTARLAAAVRLIPLGQSSAQAILHRLKPAVAHAVTVATRCPLEAMGPSLPALEIAGMAHARAAARLFAS